MRISRMRPPESGPRVEDRGGPGKSGANAMNGAPSPVSFQEVQRLAGRCQFYLLRWETEFTPCTGITAVTREERRNFGSRGVMIAPWEPRMPAARTALEQGRVVETEFSFRMAGPCAHG